MIYAVASLAGPILNGAALDTLNSHGLMASCCAIFLISRRRCSDFTAGGPGGSHDHAHRERRRDPPFGSNLDEFWNLATAALKARGVESVFYAAFAAQNSIADLDRLTSSTVWKSNHPREFIETFGAETILDGEFSAQHAVKCPKIFVWHDVEAWKDATPAQIKRSHIERDMGLYVGLTIPACRFDPALMEALASRYRREGGRIRDVLADSRGGHSCDLRHAGRRHAAPAHR